jgi:hypothetical protein
LKSILLSLDLLFAILIFSAVLIYASLNFEYKNESSLYYYDASNALDFLNNVISVKNVTLINASIYNYIKYSEYYLELNYYNQSGFVQKITIGDFKHNSNYCSQKYYALNGELIDANLCIWRENK